MPRLAAISFAAIWLIGLAASVWSTPAAADHTSSRHPLIQTVSYTTPKTGSSLKWLPYRPGTVHDDGRTIAAEHVAPVASAPAVKTTGPSSSDPFADPFDDHKKKLAVPLPGSAKSLDAAVVEGLKAESIPNDTFPQFPATGTAPPADKAAPVAQRAAPVAQQPAPAGDLKGLPAMEQELAVVRQDVRGTCPTLEDIRPISKITDDIKAESGEFPRECTLGAKTFQPRSWSPTTFTWKASSLCHKPLYFEDVQLERYGHSWGPYVQPFASAAHFFLSVPAVPYFMGLTPPNECMYTLGYYRPGSCAPYMLDPLPLSVRAALFEGAAWTGAALVFP